MTTNMTTNTTTIAGVELTVRDLDRAVDFYTRGLGLRVRAREEHEELREVQLVGDGDTAALLLVTPRAPVGAQPAPAESPRIVLLVDDVPASYARALESGGEGGQAPQHYAPLDVWYAHLRDADGYTVQLVQRRDRSAQSNFSAE